MTPRFTDHFSGVAADYAGSRPHYPSALFSYLVAVSPRTGLAWDCACGSGQATAELATHFASVVATDASAAQIARAPRYANVEYRVTPAHASGLASGAVDLVTVAQALHWLNLDAFYDEVDRVLPAGGVLAAWAYGIVGVDDRAVDRQVQQFYRDVAGPYWPAERRHVESGYRVLPFPFPKLDAPTFEMVVDWPLDRLLGYVRSWSATARLIAACGDVPVREFERALRRAWQDANTVRRIRWPIALRVCRKP